jgi:6-phosphofructokinase 1
MKAERKRMSKTIGILTAGSDCPGLNAAIRAVGKAAKAEGMNVIGFLDGFQGLVNDQALPLEGEMLSGILTKGGTILGTSREMPHAYTAESGVIDRTADAVDVYHRHHLDALVCLGGRETQESALHLTRQGLNVLTLPKGVDNDLPETDVSLGCDTAMGIAAEAIDRLHSTAHSHHRIIIVEVTGRTSGWLTVGAGITGGADIILIPELPYQLDKIIAAIQQRNQAGKHFSIIAVAEGAMSQDQADFITRIHEMNERHHTGDERERVKEQLERLQMDYRDNTSMLANRLEQTTNWQTRITILGYLLRGGIPSIGDRILATQLGTVCVRWITEGKSGVMVAMQKSEVTPVPLENIVGQRKPLSLTHPWIISARQVGTSFGV